MSGRAGQLRRGSSPKSRAAVLSIVSNSLLIALKLAAGLVTGSVAVLTEAVHSAVDLIASLVTYVSVRAADEPADASHRYGHEKFEHVAAGVEGMLILGASAIIGYEAIRHLVAGEGPQNLGIGIAVIAFSVVVNLVVSARLSRQARRYESAALAGDAAHLRADSYTSIGVLAGLVAVEVTGAAWLDAAIALAVAGVIVSAGVRILRGSLPVLVDEALPDQELAAIRAAVEQFGARGVAGYHKLRTRRAGPRRYVDLHVQFKSGTSLEGAHATAHALQDEITTRLSGADVLIHLEPEDRVQPGMEVGVRHQSGGAVGARDGSAQVDGGGERHG